MKLIPSLALLAFIVPAPLLAATRSVGPGKTYADPCAAIAAASAGDVIEIDATGSYSSTCAWATDNLTLRGVNGRPKIDLTGKSLAQSKGIFVVQAPNATFENLELTGARLATDRNGAGIRHQGTNLTVRGCLFHDNDDGILGSPLPTDGTGDVVVENSEFVNNGAGDGYSHNMYIGHYASFTLTRSYSHRAKVGHLVKSRAKKNVIAYNRITDEDGTASYELNFPNGGLTYLIGNLIQQSSTTQNPTVLAFAEEGASNPDQHLFLVNNTIVNDRVNGGTFVNVASAVTVPATLQNNLFFGTGTVCTQASAVLTTNFTGDPKLTSRGTFDYHLQAGSPAIDQGTAPGMNGGDPLAPAFQYVHPLQAEPRSVAGAAIDIGAYEFGNMPAAGTTDGGVPDSGTNLIPPDAGAIPEDAATVAPSGPPGADGGPSDAVTGGCGCGAGRGESGFTSLFAALAIGFAARRRRRASPSGMRR